MGRGLIPANRPRVAVFAPHPLLTITVEANGGSCDDIHIHAGGQGIWVARMAAEMGAYPITCSFAGGETGRLVEPLLQQTKGERRLVTTASGGGSYVVDRRGGERELVAQTLSSPPTRHELDDLVSMTTAAALESEVLVVCNPYPANVLPVEVYAQLVADTASNGTPVLVDLSSPRLESALVGKPALVKLNDWELAEFVTGPVGTPGELRAAAQRVLDLGAGMVLVTRGGDPSFVLTDEGPWELAGPRFEHGMREGCGDSMMGAIAAAWASGLGWQDALIDGAAAGAANYLRHGLGTGWLPIVASLRGRVTLRRL